VSVIFDAGRLGTAKGAVAQLHKEEGVTSPEKQDVVYEEHVKPDAKHASL
jgi:hypothetical protein